MLVEGFKRARIPKIEVRRTVIAAPLLHLNDPDIVAVATDAPLDTALPQLDINDPHAVADFIAAQVFSPVR